VDSLLGEIGIGSSGLNDLTRALGVEVSGSSNKTSL
jgi:UDP-N-acetylmuramate-alanine ligase